MAVTLTYPGVYVEEIPSGVRTITGVATSITAFIGRARRGSTQRPLLVQSFAEFSRAYGGLWAESPMTYAVQQYFLNGGRDALICRVQSGGAAATAVVSATLNLRAASEGDWGEQLRVRVEDAEADVANGEAPDSRFNLLVRDMGTGTVERFLNLSMDPNHRRFATRVLEESSNLLRIEGNVPAARPIASGDPPSGVDVFASDLSSTA